MRSGLVSTSGGVDSLMLFADLPSLTFSKLASLRSIRRSHRDNLVVLRAMSRYTSRYVDIWQLT